MGGDTTTSPYQGISHSHDNHETLAQKKQSNCNNPDGRAFFWSFFSRDNYERFAQKNKVIGFTCPELRWLRLLPVLFESVRKFVKGQLEKRHRSNGLDFHCCVSVRPVYGCNVLASNAMQCTASLCSQRTAQEEECWLAQ